jgi:hypothetical protein
MMDTPAVIAEEALCLGKTAQMPMAIISRMSPQMPTRLLVTMHSL